MRIVEAAEDADAERHQGAVRRTVTIRLPVALPEGGPHMKVFISHSWKDKHLAQKVAQAISWAGDVWYDVRELTPGTPIPTAIAAAIREHDLVIVLWSANASASPNVGAEIAMARRSRIDLLPCLLDETPLTANRHLATLLALDMRNEQSGLGRLQIALMQRLASENGIVDVAALNDIREFDGMLQYVNDYRNARGISGEDATYWALETMKATNASYASLSAWRDRVGGLLTIMQSAMARLEAIGDDRPALAALREELLAHPCADTDELRQLIQFVDGQIESLAL